MQPLTEKQQVILNYIKTQVKSSGMVPSIREICEACGISSTSSVHLQLENLEKKGYIRRKPSKNRNIEILEKNFYNDELVDVPVVGKVSAGVPTFATEYIESYFPIPITYLKNNDAFMLKISGDSMINAGIYDGDLVLVNKQSTANNRDIVIALIDDETTCKRFFIEDDTIILKPENDLYEPIKCKDVVILGKVIGIFRSF